jgi:hypothetical protein
VLLALHGILVYESANALDEDLFIDDIGRHGEELVEDAENLFIETVGDVVHKVVEHLEEEVLEIGLDLAEPTRFDVSENDIEELQHRLRRRVILEVFSSPLKDRYHDL